MKLFRLLLVAGVAATLPSFVLAQDKAPAADTDDVEAGATAAKDGADGKKDKKEAAKKQAAMPGGGAHYHYVPGYYMPTNYYLPFSYPATYFYPAYSGSTDRGTDRPPNYYFQSAYNPRSVRYPAYGIYAYQHAGFTFHYPLGYHPFAY